MKVGDYFAQKRNADFYQVAFDRSTLEDLGFTLDEVVLATPEVPALAA